uniref:Uncharacterized protein n=1 Tax=Pithovirus LCPAC401 TaxID=2506595 RepID=A0A481ZC89_9VIRU|nr:MAG: hypothetical protein LCPAC401_03780 [Pithovirus LCPAC401]
MSDEIKHSNNFQLIIDEKPVDMETQKIEVSWSYGRFWYYNNFIQAALTPKDKWYFHLVNSETMNPFSQINSSK